MPNEMRGAGRAGVGVWMAATGATHLLKIVLNLFSCSVNFHGTRAQSPIAALVSAGLLNCLLACL